MHEPTRRCRRRRVDYWLRGFRARRSSSDSRSHILLETEPAWTRFKEEVLAFTGRTAMPEVFGNLSPRESEILQRISLGLTNIEIGRELFISEKTVRNHVTRIFEKLGVQSRAQAIVLAKDHALLPGKDRRRPAV